MKKMNLVMEGWRKYLKEDLLKEQLVQEVQALIDQNQFLKGKKLTAKDEDLIQGKSFVLVLPDASIGHIKERHTDGTKPGSLLSPNIDLKTVAKKVIDMNPSEQADGRVKWLGVNVGSAIGAMGVAKTSAEEIKSMTDYQMPDGKKEMVKITAGKRKPTSELSLITAELGALSDGKKALSLITMFPGGMEVDGTTIPADRSQFAQNGLYFPVDANSPLLQKQAVPNAPSQQQVKESKMKITKQYLKRIIKEELEKVQNEGFMDFFTGGKSKNSELLKEWRALVEKCWDKYEKGQDLTPEEAGDVLRYNFSEKRLQTGMGVKKNFLTLKPRSRQPDDYGISKIPANELGEIMLKVPPGAALAIYSLVDAKMKNSDFAKDVVKKWKDQTDANNDRQRGEDAQRALDLRASDDRYDANMRKHADRMKQLELTDAEKAILRPYYNPVTGNHVLPAHASISLTKLKNKLDRFNHYSSGRIP